jgi:hypothetical protein
VDREESADFQKTGVFHVLVVAGLHVGALTFALCWAGRELRLNSAALAALILLVAKPLALRDSSFQFTFVAIGCVGGLALPWLEKSVQPYIRALRGWRDLTRDAAHEPRATQLRVDLRSLALWLSTRLPQRLGKPTGDVLVGGLSLTFRVGELLVLTVALCKPECCP